MNFLLSPRCTRFPRSVGARCSALLLWCAAAAIAQQPRGLSAADQAKIENVLAGMGRGRYLGQVADSPDGRRLAWIEDGPRGGEIHVAPFDALQSSEAVTAATTPGQSCNEGRMTWSPDSTELAFFSDCAAPGEQTDLYLAQLGASPRIRRLTDLHGYVDAPRFSPDGRRIGFLYVPGATRPAGALAAQDLPSGVIGQENVEVQRVAIAEANAAAPAEPWLATPANLHVYEFDWSPDSKSLAYVAADPPGENNWWVARLYTQKIGAGPKAILTPETVAGALHGLQIAVPRWSPDGRTIAFIGGLMSDQGVTGGDVWVIPSGGGEARGGQQGGGEPRDLTPKWPVTAGWLTWDGDGHLFVIEQAGGDTRLVRLTLDSHPRGDDASATAGKPIFSVPGSVDDGRLEHSLSATADRSLFVMTVSTFDKAPEIYAARPANAQTKGSFAGLTQLTHANDGLVSAGGKTVSLEWSNEGFHLQGWLMLPRDYDPAKKYPLICGGAWRAGIGHGAAMGRGNR